MDSSRVGASSLHLIAVLGDVLARVQATNAKEEYGLSQIDSSIKFVNQTIDARVNSSKEQPRESSEFHVVESDLSAVSKSIDAILGEARLVRGGSKRSATPKGRISTPDNAETPRKSKVADYKKTLERFSQALYVRSTKTVSASEGTQQQEPSSFLAAQEMLLKWMETKVRWTNTHAEQRCRSAASRQSSCVVEDDHEKSPAERTNAARKFLDFLWKIQSNPAGLETKAEDDDDDTANDPNDTAPEDEDATTPLTQKQVATTTQNMQKNVASLQAHRKLLDKQRPHSEALDLQGKHPHKPGSIELALQRRHHGDNEEESVESNDSWLPAKVCWSILGVQGREIVTKHGTQAAPILYSNLQEAVASIRLMHSIHSNLFHCHVQSVLGHVFFFKHDVMHSRMSGMDDVLSNANVYMCFRLTHCLVCNNGKTLISIARRVDVM